MLTEEEFCNRGYARRLLHVIEMKYFNAGGGLIKSIPQTQKFIRCFLLAESKTI